MSSAVAVTIDPSQFPENIRADLLTSLRRKQVNHKFHYDSVKQTQKWLRLHQRYSPSRHDRDCTHIYDQGFAAAAAAVRSRSVHVLGLGCGGGQKDTRLLKLLRQNRRRVFYTANDVSTAMVLVARQTALAVLPEKNCFPVVCDLATAVDLPKLLARRHPSIVTFFGMIPNFEPHDVLPKLAALLQSRDRLLFSANLAPGPDYDAGTKKVLPQYANAATRDWLMTFLTDLGVAMQDGQLVFAIERGAAGVRRIVARFHFRRARQVEVEGKIFSFRLGDSLRLFFSYRYTPERIVTLLQKYGLIVERMWITKSEEEGVFLCSRQ